MPFETEIVIDKKTGNVLLNRDHEIMRDLAELLSDDPEKFKDFFDERPSDALGRKNYNSFCG